MNDYVTYKICYICHGYNKSTVVHSRIDVMWQKMPLDKIAPRLKLKSDISIWRIILISCLNYLNTYFSRIYKYSKS